MKIEAAIQNLLEYAKSKKLIYNEDEIFVRNKILSCLNLHEWNTSENIKYFDSIDDILNAITNYAVENCVIENTNESRDLFDTKIMGIMTPYPRDIINTFKENYKLSPLTATDNYYTWNKDINYVRAGRIAKDLKWTYDCEFGTLDITINRSKPEKDPRDIANAKNAKSSDYPKCQLCIENTGYSGRIGHPARQNLVPIPIKVYKEQWYFQYSPYGYYNEHCIVFNENHIPMKIDDAVFKKLFDILDIFPHYFVGSNADLPIVGGSILSHEHFQGGKYKFAMEKAPIEFAFAIRGFENVNCGIVKWPMSVIRLSGSDRCSLEQACAYILKKWRDYSDTEVGIFSCTGSTLHNTITPIARKNENSYECDLVLRNNRTSTERPLGIFHPNPDLHHIKKENIGLIEVMGLAVLPARLANEISLLETAMLEKKDLQTDERIAYHAKWANEILLKYPEFSKENARGILEKEIGNVFNEVLCDAGVFKRNDKGIAAFKKFVFTL